MPLLAQHKVNTKVYFASFFQFWCPFYVFYFGLVSQISWKDITLSCKKRCIMHTERFWSIFSPIVPSWCSSCSALLLQMYSCMQSEHTVGTYTGEPIKHMFKHEIGSHFVCFEWKPLASLKASLLWRRLLFYEVTKNNKQQQVSLQEDNSSPRCTAGIVPEPLCCKPSRLKEFPAPRPVCSLSVSRERDGMRQVRLWLDTRQPSLSDRCYRFSSPLCFNETL